MLRLSARTSLSHLVVDLIEVEHLGLGDLGLPESSQGFGTVGSLDLLIAHDLVVP